MVVVTGDRGDSGVGGGWWPWRSDWGLVVGLVVVGVVSVVMVVEVVEVVTW